MLTENSIQQQMLNRHDLVKLTNLFELLITIDQKQKNKKGVAHERSTEITK